MEIKRDRYLDKLISKEHNGLIKVITGMRRCGKSYLIFTLFKKHLLSEGVDEDHIIEIAFDAFENKKYRDPDVLYPYLKEMMLCIMYCLMRCNCLANLNLSSTA